MTSSKEVAQRVQRNMAYYMRSGGGVTISGGEPLGQPAFAAAILKECHALGIHTAVDTSGRGGSFRTWRGVT
jgi:pyruvate formate lyase activating enzyme